MGGQDAVMRKKVARSSNIDSEKSLVQEQGEKVAVA